jgi:hypothetical protein
MEWMTIAPSTTSHLPSGLGTWLIIFLLGVVLGVFVRGKAG